VLQIAVAEKGVLQDIVQQTHLTRLISCTDNRERDGTESKNRVLIVMIKTRPKGKTQTAQMNAVIKVGAGFKLTQGAF
jgi:hypothetical protein